ncbi:hypothetical protein DHEL01_v205214 [Diaporthe helianthi]|uniref:BTB domain-containing protein n=1 Tax=Diaporthe helianthi TaxID=158607 RepID=A0A2P5I1I3_DIAHE|nr:hypothetical protein DHEL01_v205214 [Diaporthe helianthi]
MFSRANSTKQSFSKSSKYGKSSSSFSREAGVSKRRHEPRRRPTTATSASTADSSPTVGSSGVSPIVTLVIGHEQRIFAAHEDVLCNSPYFANVLKGQYIEASTKRIALPDESPEIFSSLLEYMYKGDYYPRLVHSKRRNSWEIEHASDGGGRSSTESTTIYHQDASGPLLKDTVIYCVAEKYGLEELKRVALRKQGLQTGIQCSTILASARYAYANTPDSDSKLRAHYLALIIRSRSTFKRSGTMQLEMYNGGSQLFFDLFVALCNHVDDVSSAQTTPRSNRFI